jgi:hypothetical protein
MRGFRALDAFDAVEPEFIDYEEVLATSIPRESPAPRQPLSKSVMNSYRTSPDRFESTVTHSSIV